MYFTAALLPFAYIIGLIFTFKTHRHIFANEEEEVHEEGESVPEWSIKFAFVILGISTILFGLIAESLVEQIQPSLETLGK